MDSDYHHLDMVETWKNVTGLMDHSEGVYRGSFVLQNFLTVPLAGPAFS